MGHPAAASMTVMGITIHAGILPHNHPDAALSLYKT